MVNRGGVAKMAGVDGDGGLHVSARHGSRTKEKEEEKTDTASWEIRTVHEHGGRGSWARRVASPATTRGRGMGARTASLESPVTELNSFEMILSKI